MSASRIQLEIERDVEDLLGALFPGWHPRPFQGWLFTPPDALDVWGVVSSPAAIEAIRCAGFDRVMLHGHRSDEHCDCALATRPPYPYRAYPYRV